MSEDDEEVPKISHPNVKCMKKLLILICHHISFQLFALPPHPHSTGYEPIQFKKILIWILTMIFLNCYPLIRPLMSTHRMHASAWLFQLELYAEIPNTSSSCRCIMTTLACTLYTERFALGTFHLTQRFSLCLFASASLFAWVDLIFEIFRLMWTSHLFWQEHFCSAILIYKCETVKYVRIDYTVRFSFDWCGLNAIVLFMPTQVQRNKFRINWTVCTSEFP